MTPEAYGRSWMNRAHAAIKSGYGNAINFYETQKKSFLKSLQEESEKSVEFFIEEINESIRNEIESELGETFNKSFEAVSRYIEIYLSEMIYNGKTSQSLNKIINHFSKAINEDENMSLSQLSKRLKNDIEIFMRDVGITREGLAEFVSKKSGLTNTHNTDIQNNLFGYARRMIILNLKHSKLQASITHYKAALKGYYKEELLAGALSKVLQQYNIQAVQTGSERNEKGQQIKADIGFIKMNVSNNSALKELSNMAKRLDNIPNIVNGQESKSIENSIGTLQSKSWIAPWEKTSHSGNRTWFQIGGGSGLKPTGRDAYYWHAGVYNVMSNLTKVIGPTNFMYSTGGNIYFTSDMLSNFRQIGYVFGFYLNKTKGKIVDSGIGAQPHNC